MSKPSIILSVLSLIASAQAINATAGDYHIHSSKLGNRVAKFKEENDLSEEEEVALGTVLRAAETAPRSADATFAADSTAAYFEDDTKPGTRPLGTDGDKDASGPDGAPGPYGPPSEDAGEDTVESLKAANNHDDLLALAKSEGVEVSDSATKAEIAQAILDKRAAK